MITQELGEDSILPAEKSPETELIPHPVFKAVQVGAL